MHAGLVVTLELLRNSVILARQRLRSKMLPHVTLKPSRHVGSRLRAMISSTRLPKGEHEAKIVIRLVILFQDVCINNIIDDLDGRIKRVIKCLPGEGQDTQDI